MKNTNKIFFSEKYQRLLKELVFLERDRIFCRHDLEHFLSVARISYILTLEAELDISKDLIYTTALLHDIGRVSEYKTGREHDQASSDLAKDFLEDSDFDEDQRDMILGAIRSHRQDKGEDDFSAIFYKADKLSRPCLVCPAQQKCNWPKKKMNLEISY
ncbi:HD domain-containing protein [Anaerococcus sp. AGMB09787]|uniref:HD domain-containing protein n=1 Tax=Anaerococcus sp. AGMB09787 TaxID=2922869 RepID=UPI001FB03BCD|nr:HD domain-containing protein [Anaerococcus sp. AGMB09787]